MSKNEMDSQGCGQSAREFEVLVVDDDVVDVTIIKHALAKSELPIGLQFAQNGEQALQILRREGAFANAPRPHLILLDLNMPVMDGLTFLKTFRSDSSLEQVPVVVLSTSADPTEAKRAYAAGANSVATKIASREGMESLLKSITEYWAGMSPVFYLDV